MNLDKYSFCRIEGALFRNAQHMLESESGFSNMILVEVGTRIVPFFCSDFINDIECASQVGKQMNANKTRVKSVAYISFISFSPEKSNSSIRVSQYNCDGFQRIVEIPYLKGVNGILLDKKEVVLSIKKSKKSLDIHDKVLKSFWIGFVF